MRAAYDQLSRALEEVALLNEIRPWLVEYGRWIEMLEGCLGYIELACGRRRDQRGEGRGAALLVRERIRQALKDAVDFRTVDLRRCRARFRTGSAAKTEEPLA